MSMQLDLIPQPALRRGPDYKAGRMRADMGIDRVSEATDRHSPDWLGQALARVKAFAAHQHGLFTIEQCRAVLEKELPAPSDARVWGAVTRQAKAAGFIEQTKLYAPCASSNGSPKPMYRRGGKA